MREKEDKKNNKCPLCDISEETIKKLKKAGEEKRAEEENPSKK